MHSQSQWFEEPLGLISRQNLTSTPIARNSVYSLEWLCALPWRYRLSKPSLSLLAEHPGYQPRPETERQSAKGDDYAQKLTLEGKGIGTLSQWASTTETSPARKARPTTPNLPAPNACCGRNSELRLKPKAIHLTKFSTSETALDPNRARRCTSRNLLKAFKLYSAIYFCFVLAASARR